MENRNSLQPEGGGGGDVLLVAVPEIRGAPSRGEPLAFFPEIPDVLVSGVVSLDLMVGVGGAEEEILWEPEIQSG